MPNANTGLFVDTITDEEVLLVTKLFDKKMNAQEVSKQSGLSVNRVYNVLSRSKTLGGGTAAFHYPNIIQKKWPVKW